MRAFWRSAKSTKKATGRSIYCQMMPSSRDLEKKKLCAHHDFFLYHIIYLITIIIEKEKKIVPQRHCCLTYDPSQERQPLQLSFSVSLSLPLFCHSLFSVFLKFSFFSFCIYLSIHVVLLPSRISHFPVFYFIFFRSFFLLFIFPIPCHFIYTMY